MTQHKQQQPPQAPRAAACRELRQPTFMRQRCAWQQKAIAAVSAPVQRRLTNTHIITGRLCCTADPAAEAFGYPVSVDVRDLVALEDVMEEMNLGPNG